MTAGSSPRARGTVVCGHVSPVNDRFIPACAGNRGLRPLAPQVTPVHPRVRGEQVDDEASYWLPIGSSPRARGTGVNNLRWGCNCRFIPACAGNSNTHRVPLAIRAVHPRVRGEQLEDGIDGEFSRGSSPRARGTDFR